MVLPDSVAPYDVHLIALGSSPDVFSAAAALHDEIESDGTTVLYDDRDLSAGEKFADSDLIGIPHRIIISDRTQESGNVEVVDRRRGETTMCDASSKSLHEVWSRYPS